MKNFFQKCKFGRNLVNGLNATSVGRGEHLFGKDDVNADCCADVIAEKFALLNRVAKAEITAKPI